ncbi:hypothetical protein BJY24_002671 [Nocardia transvalensis]|uniref:DUF397 domain-containing protein n=1 Tax=Nocardia transvalensis TaxID=37333 RepID=A0A7W9UHW4_9NOCA|nr:DUF397 domain-containing protein [Nocardia transvalensis]MBB5913804.1 hypothetical protein [Nocardia transvalensis]
MSTTARYRPQATGWFTSTRTNNGNQCVEVRFDGDAVLVRDSKFRRDPAHRPEDAPVIVLTAGEWMRFLGAVLGSGPAGAVSAEPTRSGGAVVRHGDIALTFTTGEWDAFVAGARDGEFDRVLV